jgi:hypothetical protein
MASAAIAGAVTSMAVKAAMAQAIAAALAMRVVLSI